LGIFGSDSVINPGDKIQTKLKRIVGEVIGCKLFEEVQGCILNVKRDIDIFLLIVVSWHIKNDGQSVNLSLNNMGKTGYQKIVLLGMKLII
jgi:hypothetical protein